MLDVKSSEDTDQQLPASPVLKQIEFNTIASGLGGLVSAIWKVHRYITIFLQKILHVYPCLVEFIKRVDKKHEKCEACRALYSCCFLQRV